MVWPTQEKSCSDFAHLPFRPMTQPNPLKTQIFDPFPTQPNPIRGSTQPTDNSDPAVGCHYFLPGSLSCRASPTFGQYQNILLGERKIYEGVNKLHRSVIRSPRPMLRIQVRRSVLRHRATCRHGKLRHLCVCAHIYFISFINSLTFYCELEPWGGGQIHNNNNRTLNRDPVCVKRAVSPVCSLPMMGYRV